MKYAIFYKIPSYKKERRFGKKVTRDISSAKEWQRQLRWQSLFGNKRDVDVMIKKQPEREKKNWY